MNIQVTLSCLEKETDYNRHTVETTRNMAWTQNTEDIIFERKIRKCCIEEVLFHKRAGYNDPWNVNNHLYSCHLRYKRHQCSGNDKAFFLINCLEERTEIDNELPHEKYLEGLLIWEFRGRTCGIRPVLEGFSTFSGSRISKKAATIWSTGHTVSHNVQWK
jgi:hypothetical protein